MARSATNSSGTPAGIVGRLAAEKKKTAAAICLIVLMGFMWVRVLSNGPESAEAGNLPPIIDDPIESAESEVKISFVDLPWTKGRHDVLAMDVFSSDNWRNFSGGSGGGDHPVNISTTGRDELARRIAAKLEFVSIFVEGNGERQAYVNDMFLSIGDKIGIKLKKEVYECEVIEIGDNKLVLRFEESEIKLELMQSNES